MFLLIHVWIVCKPRLMPDREFLSMMEQMMDAYGPLIRKTIPQSEITLEIRRPQTKIQLGEIVQRQ